MPLVTINKNVNAEHLEAKYNDGILNLNSLRKEETKLLLKKEIKVA